MFRFRRPSRPAARLALASGFAYGLPTTGDTGLGAFLGTCDFYFTGDIDDVAVFNQAPPIDGIWSKIASLFLKPLR
jgi:hypothetical protein